MAVRERQAIVLLGPPGSGKGTQGRALGELPHLLHYDMGECLRRTDEQSELGRRIRAATAEGGLLPDEVVLEIFETELERLAEEGNYRPEDHVLLLDGLPRTRGQLGALAERIELLGLVELAVEDRSELVERLRQRSLENGRIDDASEAAIQKRLARFQGERAILDELPPEILREVDASQGPLEVLGDVVIALRELLDTSRRRTRKKPESGEPRGSEWRTIG